MKKTIFTTAALLLLLISCQKIVSSTEGTLSFDDFELLFDESTKAGSRASGDYIIEIMDTKGSTVKTCTYAEVQSAGGSIGLPAGNYTLEARSEEGDIPAAAFEQPIYGVSKDFTITSGKTTRIGTLTCTLLQVKVTVSYDADFLTSITGDGAAVVTVDPSAPLEFPLSYTDGSVSYEEDAAYFAVNNGSSTTMNVVFTGLIDGKSQKMTANFTGIEPMQWRQIKFSKKLNSQGNATFTVSISDYVDDEELTVSVSAISEDTIGDDPSAPKGDGGITLELAEDCTMYSDLSNIVVPTEGKMDLRLVATVPGGIRKFVVDMASTSTAFLDAVALAGGTHLDLLNPTEDQEIVFQIVPFPHGAELAGKTEVAFDLSGAQEPILLFPGTHTFTMTITDSQGCKNSIPVSLIVNQTGK